MIILYLRVFNDLIAPELTLTVDSVNEAYWAFSYFETHCLRSNHHLHLKCISFTLCLTYHSLQYLPLVEPKTPSQIAYSWVQDSIGKQIGSSRNKFPLEIPTEDPTISCIARPCNDIVIPALLDADHRREELWMMGEIGVHNDHKCTGSISQTMDIGCPETEFTSAGFQHDVFWCVEFLELFCDCEGTIRRTIVDNDDFPIKLTARVM